MVINKKHKQFPVLSALKGRIREKELSYLKIARKMNISLGQFSNKINGYWPFSVAEMEQICVILDIAPNEVTRFFMPEYYKTQQLSS